jgi:CRISPR-associated protein Cas2
MNYLVMYDITDHKVRALVAKYLKSKGCIRIQKSVFMANSSHSTFNEIHETLKEVNAEYENEDSIMLVPVNVADVRSMKLVGRNVSVDILTDPPSTLFF